MSATLLSYAVSASQSPIQASPQTGDPSIVTLMIIVSNSTHQLIDCQSISFGFLQGTDAKDFFPDSTGIGASAPTGWNITQNGSLFTATPDTTADGQIGADGLTFVLSNIQVNQQPGTTDMTVTEVTSGSTGTLDVPLAKFPTQFTVGQLDANPISVEQGQSTTLSWNGSGGATYELQYQDANDNVVTITQTTDGHPLPSVGSYTIDSLQVNPTIFYLIVTLAVPGQDQPVTFHRWFPVTVSIPPVQINSFTANTQMVSYPGDEVTLSWDVTAATQVQLNGVNIEGNSAVVQVNEPTTFVLQALGQGGPATATIFVAISPVKINSLTANPSVVYGQNNSVPVTLAWNVQSANQLLVNNSIVMGESVTVPVNEATSFTLEATGYGGSVYDQIAVSIEDVNLTIWEADDNINVSFGANAGTYSALITISYLIFGGSVPLVSKISCQVTAGNPGAVQFSQNLGAIADFSKILFSEVTLSGFASGPVTATYTPKH